MQLSADVSRKGGCKELRTVVGSFGRRILARSSPFPRRDVQFVIASFVLKVSKTGSAFSPYFSQQIKYFFQWSKKAKPKLI